MIHHKKSKGDFKGSYDEILFVKDNRISRIKENIPSPAEAGTHNTFRVQQDSNYVNKKITLSTFNLPIMVRHITLTAFLYKTT